MATLTFSGQIAMLTILAILAISHLANGMGVDLTNVESIDDDADRAIIVATGLNTGNILGVNLTNILPLLALGAAALLPLLCICALGALLVAKLAHDKGNDSGHSGYSSSTYSAYSRALGLDDINWESLSILDWVAMGEEIFRKFDPTSLECHKRVICDLHQNAKTFGTVAGRIVDMFGYLRYSGLLNLPDIVQTVLDEYTDAADHGRSLNKDCGDIYSECDFSIKEMYDKYSDNSIE